jgi:hypothetical protein
MHRNELVEGNRSSRDFEVRNPIFSSWLRWKKGFINQKCLLKEDVARESHADGNFLSYYPLMRILRRKQRSDMGCYVLL